MKDALQVCYRCATVLLQMQDKRAADIMRMCYRCTTDVLQMYCRCATVVLQMQDVLQMYCRHTAVRTGHGADHADSSHCKVLATSLNLSVPI
jgi:hypothetical protein